MGLDQNQYVKARAEQSFVCPDEVLVEGWWPGGRRLSLLLGCDRCGATSPYTFQIMGDEANVLCPRGHRYTAPFIQPPSVRQLQHLIHTRRSGRPLLFPDRPGVVCTMPVLRERRALVPAPAKRQQELLDEAGWRWSRRIERDFADWPAALQAYALARHVMALALPRSADLWQQLHPAAGGSTVDAHMTAVLIGLAVHETGRRTSAPSLRQLSVDAVIEEALAPDAVPGLRHARPVTPYHSGRFMYAVRRRDAARLEAADGDRFASWCQMSEQALRCAQQAVLNAPAATPRHGQDVRFTHISGMLGGDTWEHIESLQWHHTIDSGFNSPRQNAYFAVARWWDWRVRRVRSTGDKPYSPAQRTGAGRA